MLKKYLLKFFKIAYDNAIMFFFTIGFVLLFQYLFGAENTLIAVAISVGITMLPFMDNGIKLSVNLLLILLLYLSSVFVAQFALTSHWLAFFINFFYVLFLLSLSCEPMSTNHSISFLLCFVFAQSTPVPFALFPTRLIATFLASLISMITMIIVWHKRGYGKQGITLKAQIKRSIKNKSYLFRLALGLAIAMFIAMYFDLQKPLWISIVVMSLTQVEFKATFERIIYRSYATFVGIIIFTLLFRVLIPEQYALGALMIMGYFSFFIKQYRHKQIYNAISAINASLLFLDTFQAFSNRILCLISGIVVVLILWGIEQPLKSFYIKLSGSLRKEVKEVC
ncbi:MAG: FUSC family protein [Erysipelotrichia bacterium]|nr:FUSC family protein [Erysipelotrichia bacterium]NCC53877.1 FUSC family protein [Erysipelotrichia bacterium]